MSTEDQVQDRGDNVADDTAAAAAAAQATTEAEAAAAAAAEKAAAEATDKTATTADGQPRDTSGKFTKKEGDDTLTVPKARFDEAVTKERERAELAERRLAELTAQQETAAAVAADLQKMEDDLKALRAEARKADLDGKDDEATALLNKADALNREIAVKQAQQQSTQIGNQAIESFRVDLAIETIQTQYPQLKEGTPEFDEDYVELVLAKQNRYINDQGMSASKALLRAANEVMSKFVKAQAPAADTSATDTKKTETVDERKAEAVKRNIDAANRQPGSLKQMGEDSDKAGAKAAVEVNKMNFKEFSALPADELAKLRGDFVE